MTKFLCVATLNTAHLAMCEIMEAEDQLAAEEMAMEALGGRVFRYIYDLYVSASPTHIVLDTHQPKGRRISSMSVNP